MKNIIIMEGDGPIAQMQCGNCGEFFRGDYRFVTTANKVPICKDCIEWANPLREERGLPPMPYNPNGYNVEEVEVH